MLCPVCHVELRIADRQGIEIDYCPKCRGVWLDRGELDKIIARSAAFEQRAVPPAAPYSEGENAPYVDYDDDDYRPRYDDDRHPPYGKKKRKSFLGDMFDIFD